MIQEEPPALDRGWSLSTAHTSQGNTPVLTVILGVEI